MGGRNKLIKFNYLKDNDKVLERGKELLDNIKGSWNKVFFKNNFPIVLEVGCGKGEYTIGLAEKFPKKKCNRC